MTSVHHLNCVKIESPFGSAIGHCLLLKENDKLVLIDAGIGLLESREPEKHLGKELIEVTGFVFDETLTALHQIKALGLNPTNLKHIICSHLDPDHIGGLADFPWATVHVSKEEYDSFISSHERYLPQQLAHQPKLQLYASNDANWFGLPARRLDLDMETELYLIPLFGHTLGHCGVALKVNGKWIFYAGDAYYLRAELQDKNHPVDQLATIRAVDNTARLKSLETVRQLLEKHGSEIEYFGYHDPTEFLG
ncbi:MAG: MBL fold metallo-hydrolase [Bacteroidota bacterium]